MAAAFLLGELLAAGYAAIVIWGLLISLLPVTIGGSLWKIRKREFFLLIVMFIAGVFLIRVVEQPKEAFGYVTESLDITTVSGEVESIKDNAVYSNVVLGNAEVIYNGKAYYVGRILLYISNVSNLRLGDVIAASGELSSFLVPRNDGEFNLYNYYKSRGIYYKVFSSDNVAKVLSVKKYLVSEWFDTVRDKLTSELLEHSYSIKDAGTMSAILLGEKDYLEDELQESFRTSGISHVLVVSGLHISLIGMGIFELLKRLAGYVPACIGASVAVIFYVWLTGFGPSGQRALIMFGVSMLGNITGKSYDLCSGVGFALLCMLIKTPYIFLGSSFVMSFMSVFAIGTIGPVLEDICKWALKKKMTGVVSGLAIFWMTLPVVLWNYYEYSLYGLLLNLIIIPCMSVLVILGAGGLLGEISMGVGEVLLKGPVHILLFSFEKMSMFFNEMSVGRILFGKPSLKQVIGVYTLLSVVVCVGFVIKQLIKRQKRLPAFVNQKKFKHIFAVFLIVGITILEIFILLPKNKGVLEITMLDVGQGECIFTRLPTGENMLIDAGSSDVKNLYEKRVKNFLKARAVSKLDYIIISHADEDHCSAVEELFNKEDGMEVGCLVLPDVAGEDDKLKMLSRLACSRGSKVITLGRGDTIRIGEVMLYCINPDSGGHYTDDDRNDSSIVLHMKYRGFDMLFTGDIGVATERELVSYLEKCEVLKVAHHGSKYSNSQLLLERVSPGLALISCSEDNSYGHPHNETLERLEAVGCKVISTAEAGAVTIRIGKKIEVYRFVK